MHVADLRVVVGWGMAQVVELLPSKAQYCQKTVEVVYTFVNYSL
jgi:hypothetical protein